MEWYLKVLKNYVQFDGRARRKEYWMFVLFNVIFLMAAMILDNLLGLTFGGQYYGVFYFLYILAMLLPLLAVYVRRLHDIEKSGWWVLIAFVPVIGSIWLLVLMCTPGTVGPNKYGADPILAE